MLECGPGIYDRFDFTDPFTCLNDFMRYIAYADMSVLPPYFVVRYEDEGGGYAHVPIVWTREKTLFATRDSGSIVNAKGARPDTAATFVNGVHHARLLICDSLRSDWSPAYLYGWNMIAAKTLTVSSGKALAIQPRSIPVSFDRTALTISLSAVIQEERCGAGGSPTECISPPNGTLQGVSGAAATPSGAYLGTGGGGSGGAAMKNAVTSGYGSEPLSGGGGADGSIWCGGNGGQGEYSTVDPYGNVYKGSSGSANGGITCCLYADIFSNAGIISVPAEDSKSNASQGISVASGRPGGGCLVVHSPDVASTGNLAVSQGAQCPSSVNAYGGNGGDGSYKVVAM